MWTVERKKKDRAISAFISSFLPYRRKKNELVDQASSLSRLCEKPCGGGFFVQSAMNQQKMFYTFYRSVRSQNIHMKSQSEHEFTELLLGVQEG